MKPKMMIVLLSVLVLFALAACGQAVGPQDPRPAGPTGPADGGAALAPVEQLDILILESFPVQVNARVSGKLPDRCTVLGEPEVVLEGRLFRVLLPVERVAEVECGGEPVDYETGVGLPVLGLSAGTYTVDLNGTLAEFTLDVDNSLPEVLPAP